MNRERNSIWAVSLNILKSVDHVWIREPNVYIGSTISDTIKSPQFMEGVRKSAL